MERARSISKSMISYLKRAQKHKEFLLKESKEFERGKRHLANMMGIEPNEMTQSDIDDAMKYLFPAALFDKKSWPMMKHPDLLYKSQKDAQFDSTGRPYHYLFYTVKPNYYEALSEIAKLHKSLDAYEDSEIAKGILEPPEDGRYISLSRVWISELELSKLFIENIDGKDYEYFIKCLERLAKHPYSNRLKYFFEKYSTPLTGQSTNLVLPELQRDEKTGQIFTEIRTRCRETRLKVKTVLNGTGKFDIDGKDILYFDEAYVRRIIFSPILLSNMVDKVDIYATIEFFVDRPGQAATATAIRQAVAESLAAHVDEETRERLRLAGFLTVDTRVHERKKFNHRGARAKPTWKKR